MNLSKHDLLTGDSGVVQLVIGAKNQLVLSWGQKLLKATVVKRTVEERRILSFLLPSPILMTVGVGCWRISGRSGRGREREKK